MALTSTEEALVRQLLDQQAAILALANNEATITSKLGATKVTLSDLTSAVAIADADLFLIRQGVTDKSVAGSLIKDLSTQPDASETVKGIVELATVAEAAAGTDTVRAVTPAGVAAAIEALATQPDASETVKGIVELATVAEAAAGTDTVRAVTPAGVRGAVNASGSAPIYAARAWANFNAVGTPAIRSSGNVSSITDNAVGQFTINFATALPSANYSVSGCVGKYASADSHTRAVVESLNYSTTSFSFGCVNHNAGTYHDDPAVSLTFFN